MNIDVTMPQLGETVSEGTITRWLRQVGDLLADQEPLLEISTDKVDTEVPAPAAGRLLQILVPEDSTVSVGTLLAVIGSEAAADVIDDPRQLGPGPAPVEPAPPTPLASATGPVAETGRPRHVHSPRVRRLAAEAGLRLDKLRGSGPGGRVTAADVTAAARHDHRVDGGPAAPSPAPQPVTPAPAAVASRHQAPPGLSDRATAPVPASVPANDDRVEPLTGTRALIADRMVRSPRTAAQLTSVVEVDVTPVVALRRDVAAGVRERLGLTLTLTAFFAKAAIEALRTFPVLNASIGEDGRSVTYHSARHLGLAVDTDRGLMVPVVKNAGDLSLLGLSRRIEDLAARSRSGSLSPDDLTGGTFTLTDTGSRGVLFDTPILVPGQVGILGTGAVVERPAIVRLAEGEPAIAVRSIAYLALTYDHRLVDGADAARFLMAVKERLEGGQFHDELA